MPKQAFSLLGNRPTGKLRIRNRFLFGVIIEEQWESQDGSVEWRPANFPVVVSREPR